MKEHTFEEYENLIIRKRKLLDAAEGVAGLVSGTGLSICPYMQDENGNYSEERTLATVEELMEALKIYLGFDRGEESSEVVGQDEDGEDIYAFDRYEMSEDEIACYRAFLYCALRELYINYDYTLGDYGDPYRQTFGELIAMARDPQVFRSYHDFLRYQYTERFAEPTYFLFPLRENPENSIDSFLGTREGLAEIGAKDHQRAFQAYYMATDEEMERMLQSLTGEETERVAKRLELYEIATGEMEFDEEGSEEEWESLSEEEKKEREELDKLIDLEYEQQSREYRRKLEKKCVHFDRYQEQLDRYLHLQHLRGTPEGFHDAIRGMVDYFLLDKGKSCCGDPDLFYKSIVYLQRAAQQISALIRKSKG